jgi:hypothetical protein
VRQNAFTVVLALTVAATAAVSAAEPKPKGPDRPARDGWVQHCTVLYEARVAALHAPNSPTGKARLRAMHAAAETKKACIARARR